MPKNKAKMNGVALGQESVCLMPQDEEGGLNYKRGGANGHAYLPAPPHAHNGPPDPEDHGKRGVGLDFAILDSTFLLSQVFPTLFMGIIVQLTQSVTAYIASSAIFGLIAIYLAQRIVFDQRDLKR